MDDRHELLNFESLYWIYWQIGGLKKKWTTLVHNGVMFPPEYKPHGIPVLYEGVPVVLNSEQEEAATMYAKYVGTNYVENPRFRKNFWTDWKKILGPGTVITSLEGVDFGPIKSYLDKVKEDKKLVPKEERDREKAEKAVEEEKYRFAIVDGKREPVGNFRVEGPGLFIGRGQNPLIGLIKRRIWPEDVVLNLGKEAPVPETLSGHKWGGVVHDRNVDWLASWKDDVTGKMKYVWLGAHSEAHAQADIAKFDLARKLRRKIKTVREQYVRDLSDPDPKVRQLATAVYFIDTFALRVGNEKGEDSADTVGVTTLRVEHVDLLEGSMIKLSFLGKDSVAYKNVATVPAAVYRNVKEFEDGKSGGDQLFDRVTSNDVNKYLQQFMKGLTAKVFRTFNASYIFDKELRKISKKYEGYTGDDREKKLLEEFNKANLKVAKLCNHQKGVSKCYADQVAKINDQISSLNKELKGIDLTPAKAEKIRGRLKALKAKKKVKSETKNLSLGTSKINYIDPRIIVAFMKRSEIPVDKLFTKALQEKFRWAFGVGPDYRF